VLGRFGLATAPTARKLISDCRARSPDVTASEICVFVQEAVESLRSRKNLHSPMGLLLRIVNEQCDPTSLFEYRQRVQRAQAQAARVQAQKRESLMAEYRACLASPELPESERAYITEFLRDNGVELPVN
jgi:hypothetical protein